jgi:hypothetical protein
MKRSSLIAILLSACLILSACNMPSAPASDGSALSTAAAQTVQAVLSPEATQPLATATSADSVTSTTTAACEDLAKYTAWTRDDATYDVTEVNRSIPPEDTFNMSWTLQNTGTCIWDDAYRMHFDYGTQLTNAEDFPMIPIGAQVPPGETVTITIPMSAPELPGEYESNFSLLDGNGESVISFGVLTKVGNTSTVSLTSPGDLRYTYDCTSGAVEISLSWVDRAASEDGYRIYRDGKKITELAAGSTSYSEFAPSSGKYDYTVASYNGGGESPATVKVNTDNCQ